jgi:hypothetical protein
MSQGVFPIVGNRHMCGTLTSRQHLVAAGGTDPGAPGRMQDGIGCWACLDRGHLAGGDLRLHLREQERAVDWEPESGKHPGGLAATCQ